jgi:hypothetical protein
VLVERLRIVLYVCSMQLRNPGKQAVESLCGALRNDCWGVGRHFIQEHPCRSCLVEFDSETLERLLRTLHDAWNSPVQGEILARQLLAEVLGNKGAVYGGLNEIFDVRFGAVLIWVGLGLAKAGKRVR